MVKVKAGACAFARGADYMAPARTLGGRGETEARRFRISLGLRAVIGGQASSPPAIAPQACYPDGAFLITYHCLTPSNPADTLRSHGQSHKRYFSPAHFPIERSLTAPGTLVKCDASIKAMLVDIDSKNHNEYIIEELDEEHILVKETKINELKARLNNVSIRVAFRAVWLTAGR